MILEVAILDVKPGETAAFETAFQQAQSIISSMTGYGGHQLQKCLEKDNRYILLVNWQTLEDHIPKAFVDQRNIKSGKRCSIISTIRFLWWNIIS